VEHPSVRTLQAFFKTAAAAVSAVLFVNLLGWALRTAETRPWTYAVAAALVIGAFVVLRGGKSAGGPILYPDLELPRAPSDPSEYYAWGRAPQGTHTYYDVLVPPPVRPMPRLRSRSLTMRAVAAAGIVLGTIAALVLLLPWLVRSAVSYNLTASAFLVLALMAITLRPTVLRRQTWKTMSDIWLKFPSISSFGIMTFGVLGFVGTFENAFIRSGMAYSQVSPATLGRLYLGTVLLLGIAYLATTAGKASSGEDTNTPLWFFGPALTCAWLANLGAYTLFLDGVILSLYAHLA
jgi:hypothetical protein